MNALVESWQILKRRWLPAAMTLGTVVGAASIYNSLQQATYEAKGQILIKGHQPEMLLASPEPTNFKNSPAQWLRSLPVAQKTVTELQLSRTPEQVLENISVQKIANQDLLAVSYRDTDPQRAAQVVQKLMTDYLAQDSELRRQEATTQQTRLEKQLSTINNEVKLAEANLQKFKTDFKITALQNEKKSLTSAISQLQAEIKKSNSQLIELASKSPATSKIFGSSSVTILRSILVSPSPSMQQILAALQGVEEKLAVEKTQSSTNSREIEDLTSQQGVLWGEVQKESQQSLISNNRFRALALQWKQSGISEDLQFNLVQAETQRDVIEKRIAVLNSSIKKGQSQLAAFSPSENKVQLLEQNVKAARNKYAKLATQIKSVQIVKNQAIPLAKIIDRAIVPHQPIFTPNRINPLWTILTGLSLGGVLAVGLDRADKRLKSAAAVQKIIRYPMLGCIPNFPQWTTTKTSKLLTNKDHKPEHEPFRDLQSHLKFLENQGSTQIIVTQVIVISSAVHREGKSTVAAQLALAAAQTGQRVLLVDADLYHPQQHQLWRVGNSIGLTSVLRTENQFPESIVEVAENLGLLPAGPAHEQPSTLFNSPVMTDLFIQWFALYDLVVIDTTPLNQSAEAMILAKMADGLMLVVNPQIAETADLENAQDLLQQAQQHVLGVVINGIEYSEYQRLVVVEQSLESFSSQTPVTSLTTVAEDLSETKPVV
jgi:polysaccharide biosynthesis transport protein